MHFIAVPFAFNETVLLLFGAFLDKFDGIGSTWASVEAQKPASNADRMSPYLEHLLLRMLTTDRFHPSMSGEPPMDVVKRDVAWFADAREVHGQPGPLMDHLTMSLIDYALAHELGHRLLDHTGITRLAGLEARIAAEIDADRVGFHLFTTSWGWRDELMDEAPLSPLARIVLGPLCFSMFERWYSAVLSGFATSCLNAGVDPGFNVGALDVRRQESDARMRATFDAIGTHRAQSIAKGASFRKEDQERIEWLTKLMIDFSDDLLTQAKSMPDHAVRSARRLSRPFF